MTDYRVPEQAGGVEPRAQVGLAPDARKATYSTVTEGSRRQAQTGVDM